MGTRSQCDSLEHVLLLVKDAYYASEFEPNQDSDGVEEQLLRSGDRVPVPALCRGPIHFVEQFQALFERPDP